VHDQTLFVSCEIRAEIRLERLTGSELERRVLLHELAPQEVVEHVQAMARVRLAREHALGEAARAAAQPRPDLDHVPLVAPLRAPEPVQVALLLARDHRRDLADARRIAAPRGAFHRGGESLLVVEREAPALRRST
jgi:hypothetical protein